MISHSFNSSLTVIIQLSVITRDKFNQQKIEKTLELIHFFCISCDVVIRTVGDQTELELNAPNSNVNFYGFAKKVDVTAIKNQSLHIYGTVYQLEVESGHVAVENTGIVFELQTVEAAGSVSNAGYIAENKSTATIEGKPASKTYEINSLERLEGFRDAVNAGNNFEKLTVELTQDIALKDGWQPIGEGARKVLKQSNASEVFQLTHFFAGTFDGKNHTISNLNNKGFEPTRARLVKDDGVDTYAYGLFGLTTKATIKNLKLTQVNISQDIDKTDANIDSVGALVGYAYNGITVDNVSVSGSLIKGHDAVCGVVGRVSLGDGATSITNCSNSTRIESEIVCAGVARVYDAKTGYSFTFTNNANTGEVVTSNAKPYDDALLIYTSTVVITDNTGNTHMGHAVESSQIQNAGNESKLG